MLKTSSGWVLIDPHKPDIRAVERLSQLIYDLPIATVLTSDGHERSCYELRTQFNIPIWGPEYQPAARQNAYEGEPDHIYKEDDTLPGDIKPIKINGAWGGDHVLIWKAPTGQIIAFTGDIVNGQVDTTLGFQDHYRSSPGLAFGSRLGYIERHGNPEGMKESVQCLIDEDIDCICGSHSIPHWNDPKAELARLSGTL